MGIIEFIVVVVLAILVATIFFYGFKSRGAAKAFWILLFILFLAGWAGRLWINPAGPVLWGYAWLPVFFFVFIIALLIALASPGDSQKAARNTRLRESQTGVTEPEEEAGAAFGILFWVLILFLFTAIVVGTFRY